MNFTLWSAWTNTVLNIFNDQKTIYLSKLESEHEKKNKLKMQIIMYERAYWAKDLTAEVNRSFG